MNLELVTPRSRCNCVGLQRAVFDDDLSHTDGWPTWCRTDAGEPDSCCLVDM